MGWSIHNGYQLGKIPYYLLFQAFPQATLSYSATKKILNLWVSVIFIMLAMTEGSLAEPIFECEVEQTLQFFSMHLTIDEYSDIVLNIKKQGKDIGSCNYHIMYGKYRTRVHIPRLVIKMGLDSCSFQQKPVLLKNELSNHVKITMELASKTEYLMPFLEISEKRVPRHCRLISYNELKLNALLEKKN